MELQHTVYSGTARGSLDFAPPVFYVTPHSDEHLALHVGDAVIPIQRYSNPVLVARTAAMHLAELLGDALGDRVLIQFENVFEGLGSITVEVPLESVKISSIARKLKGFDPRVVERVIEIAEEIREEGREGKKIGTLFVIGDPNELALYTKQLILNPFKGYLPEERNILNEELKETIKEFAQLDGAFIIGKDGLYTLQGRTSTLTWMGYGGTRAGGRSTLQQQQSRQKQTVWRYSSLSPAEK